MRTIYRSIAIGVIIIRVSITLCFGQNLINNHSFEAHVLGMNNCVYTIEEWDTRYTSYHSLKYSDKINHEFKDTLFNVIVVNANCNNGVKNAYGHQKPQDGHGYLGLTYLVNYKGERSWQLSLAQTKLKHSLTKEQKYLLKYYVSLSDYSVKGVNAVCAAFTAERIKEVSSSLEECYCANSIIVDKENWVLVKNILQAEGGESYISFGNFLSNDKWVYKKTKTDKKNKLKSKQSIHYYLDNIGLYPIYKFGLKVFVFDTLKTDTTENVNKKLVNQYTPEFYFPDTNQFAWFDTSEVIVNALLNEMKADTNLYLEIKKQTYDPMVYERPEQVLIDYLKSEGIREERIKVTF